MHIARILDGKAVATQVREQVKASVEDFTARRSRPPSLHVVLVGDDPSSRVYVRNKNAAAKKVGIDSVTHTLPATTSEEEILALVSRLNADDAVDAILVQLPLPKGINESRVIDAISPLKDADGLHPLNAGLLVAGRPRLVPCTPQGCMRLIDEAGIALKGQHAVVVGRSLLMGKPMAQLLLAQHATVTIAHSRTRDLPLLCARADVLVAAVGRARMIKGDWIACGAVVIDVGINQLESGELVGDVDFEPACERARAITPVPGGVGPVTIAYLLKNTVAAAELRANLSAGDTTKLP